MKLVMKKANLSASVRAKLLNKAKETKQDFSLVLSRYALERLLYRLSISPHADDFLLKGALLFASWFDTPHRATRDADFLGFGSSEPAHLQELFGSICAIKSNDGMVFDPQSIKMTESRNAATYPVVRITLLGDLAGARCSIQIDVGFGDAVTPGPEKMTYPVILAEFAAPKLRAYPTYTVVAEKLEALTTLGIANSRLKDYFDLWFLSAQAEFEFSILQRAIRATFERRNSPLPIEIPFGLSASFSNGKNKQLQWQAFLKKNKLDIVTLESVVNVLRKFLEPVLAPDKIRGQRWLPGGPWTS